MATEDETESLIVMGPAKGSTPRKHTEPPPFNSTTNKFKWRADVRNWARLLRRLGSGGDNKSKALMNALGDSLYLAVDESTRHKLDRAINNGILTLDPQEGDPEHKEMVETILKIVAPDSPTDSVKRLVKMMQNIHNCKRKTSETPEAFARRFEGLASLYLNHCNTDNADQDSQLFAMILLENASLSDTTFDHIILQLISHSGTQVMDPILEVISISKHKLNQLVSSLEKLKRDYTGSTDGMPDNFAEDIGAVIEKGNKLIKGNKTAESEDRSQSKLSLEEAIKALSEVKATGNATQELKTKGTMLGKRQYPHGNAPQNKRQFIPEGQGPKANSTCHGCGAKGHWWKDRIECIEKVKEKARAAALKKDKGGWGNRTPNKTANEAPDSEDSHDDRQKNTKASGSFFRRQDPTRSS